MIQDNQQSRFIQENKMRGEEKGTAGVVQGRTKVSFINTDDTFIQPAHNHPSSHPIIKHYAALRTHAPCPPSHFLWKHALVLHRAEICKQESRVALHTDVMLLNLMYSGGLRMDLRGNWVALGHKECHGFVSPTALTAVVIYFYRPINVQGIKYPLQTNNVVPLWKRTGENCLPRHTKRKHHRLSKSLAQTLRAMPRTYCRKSHMNITSRPSHQQNH